MLPNANENTSPPTRTIFINPNFTAMTQSNCNNPTGNAVTHVNPLFLQQRQQSVQKIHMNPQFIHMNPAFYQKKLMEQQLLQLHQQQQQHQHLQQQPHSQAQIVNVALQQSACIPIENGPLATNTSVNKIASSTFANATAPLLHLSRRKLIRSTTKTTIDPAAIRQLHPIVPAPANTKLNAPSGKFRYKLDRRKLPTNIQVVAKPSSKLTIKSQYLLKKLPNQILRPSTLKTKISRTLNPPDPSPNRKLKLVSINNILYKSTRNKLQRNDAANKVILLRRKSFTITASNKKTLITQQTRTYLNNAKQRSLQQLVKRYVKTNEPCAVYQRLGKCASHERGRCNKKHDKQQVILCPKLLRGDCFNSNCLLSHNISLAKMPVCKFYLQGLCVRNNCPYLHKKLNEKAGVCTDFLRGFCSLAEKCDKRHEFLCPELALKKKCTLANCLYCKQTKRQIQKPEITINTAELVNVSTQPIPMTVEEEEHSAMRYFDGKDVAAQPTSNDTNQPDGSTSDDDNNQDQSTVGSVFQQKRPKIGILPAFIPLT